MKTLSILLAGSALALATGAAAQDTQTQTEPPATTSTQDMPADPMAQEPPVEPMVEEDTREVIATEEAPAEQPMADTAADTSFSDAEVESFAAAAVEIQTLEGDEATKQQQAVEIVAQSGIEAETFNAIATAMQTDTELAERVRLAAAALQQQPTG